MSPIMSAVAGTPPAAGHHISFARLGRTDTLPLAELHARAARVARELAASGLGRGDRIGVIGYNCPSWVLLDLAAVRLGVVTAGFDPTKFRADEALCRRYGLKALFTDQDVAGAGIRRLDEVAAMAEREGGQVPPPVTYGPADVTTFKFTSGSTGEPKGLAATVGSIESSMREVQRLFSHGPGDNLFVFLPLSVVQQRYWVYSALYYGHDVTVSTYEAAFAALRQCQPTVVMAVPGFYETARRHVEAHTAGAGTPPAARLESARAAARDLFGSRIRYLWTGSAPASVPTLEFFDALGLPVYEGYGLNEACIVSKNHPGASKVGSSGQVLPSKRVTIAADGTIHVRSDYPVNWRYEYAAPGESERMFGDDGVVRTGDLGYVDDEGYLHVLGRADDVLVLRNGRKVIAGPLQERVRTHPAVDECVLFAPDGTDLVAVVSPADEDETAAAIEAHVAGMNAGAHPDDRIRHVVVARPRFSLGNGLLSAQFKPQRQRVYAAFEAEINARLRSANGQ